MNWKYLLGWIVASTSGSLRINPYQSPRLLPSSKKYAILGMDFSTSMMARAGDAVEGWNRLCLDVKRHKKDVLVKTYGINRNVFSITDFAPPSQMPLFQSKDFTRAGFVAGGTCLYDFLLDASIEARSLIADNPGATVDIALFCDGWSRSDKCDPDAVTLLMRGLRFSGVRYRIACFVSEESRKEMEKFRRKLNLEDDEWFPNYARNEEEMTGSVKKAFEEVSRLLTLESSAV